MLHCGAVRARCAHLRCREAGFWNWLVDLSIRVNSGTKQPMAPGAEEVTRMVQRNKQYSSLATGIAVGLAVGAVFGVALDNLALGLGPGIALGIAISLALSNRKDRAVKSDSEHDDTGQP